MSESFEVSMERQRLAELAAAENEIEDLIEASSVGAASLATGALDPDVERDLLSRANQALAE